MKAALKRRIEPLIRDIAEVGAEFHVNTRWAFLSCQAREEMKADAYDLIIASLWALVERLRWGAPRPSRN